MSFICGINKGRKAILALRVYIGSLFHQKSDNIQMSFICGNHKGRKAILVLRVYIGSLFHQKTDNIKMSFTCGKNKGRITELALRVYGGSLFHQKSDNIQMSSNCGNHKGRKAILVLRVYSLTQLQMSNNFAHVARIGGGKYIWHQTGAVNVHYFIVWLFYTGDFSGGILALLCAKAFLFKAQLLALNFKLLVFDFSSLKVSA